MLSSFLKGKNKEEHKNFDNLKIPQHVAIIMDGNGRWAKKRGMPRSMGHAKGAEVLKKIVKVASKINIKALTVYAFSTENWKRPEKEVSYIMELLEKYLKNNTEELHENNIKIRFIGDLTVIDESLQTQIYKAHDLTENNTGLTFQVALNYGGRDEITRAVKAIAKKTKNNDITIDEIDMDLISSELDTKEFSNVDLLIRPGGDYRISNFLLWQMAYAEFWFTEKLWPDFTKDVLMEAILAYQGRDRRFGGIKDDK